MNVCMLDVFMILACVCICMFPDFGLMSGNPRGMLVCFRTLSDAGQGPRNVYTFMLCDYLCVFIDMFIRILSFARCLTGPDVGLCPMPSGARCRAVPNEGAGPMICYM